MTKSTDIPKKQIIVFGCTYIGIQIATELQRTHEVTLCDNQPDQIDIALEKELPAILIDYTDDEKLKFLGIGRHIDIIFMAFEADSANVFVTLSARFLDQNLHIVALASNDDAKNSLISAGCDRIIKPYEMIGREIYNLIDRPLAMDVLSSVIYGEASLTLSEVPIPENSHFIGQSLKSVNIHQSFNLILIGIMNHKNQPLIFSQAHHPYQIKAADILMLIGEKEDIKKFQHYLTEHLSEN